MPLEGFEPSTRGPKPRTISSFATGASFYFTKKLKKINFKVKVLKNGDTSGDKKNY